jgi:predicted nucleic acid-binding protein
VNVVDSSAWIEYLADRPNAAAFAAVIEDDEQRLVPTLTLYEVFRFVNRTLGEDAAFAAVSTMMRGTVLDLTAQVAVEAARLSVEHGLAMADAMILAACLDAEATLWTQDAHFEGLAGVEFRRKSNDSL